MQKNDLRLLVRQRKRQFTQEQLSGLSLPIVDRLKKIIRDAQTIVAYYSLDDEVDTHNLIDELLSVGKTVYLPKVVDDYNMILCKYSGEDSLQKGAFGIMEPVCNHSTTKPSIDVILVPGMAFDAQGHRLGRGKGYYDRFLSALPEPRPLLLGVCFDFQKVVSVPTEACDISVDLVV